MIIAHSTGNMASPARKSVPEPRSSAHESRVSFLGEFIRNPLAVGTVVQTGRAVARAMARSVPASARTIIEYGPGLGAITDLVMQTLPPNFFETGGRYVAIESSAPMARDLAGRFSDMDVWADDAAKVERLAARSGVDPGEADCIVSGITWSNLSDVARADMLTATFRMLRPGGTFIALALHGSTLLHGGQHFRSLLADLFRRVRRTSVIWANLPPAVVYVARK